MSRLDLTVISKWGKDGEVEHESRDVPVHAGELSLSSHTSQRKTNVTAPEIRE